MKLGISIKPLRAALILSLTAFCLLTACSNSERPGNRAVYLLIDISGTYTEELDKAQSVISYLLGALESGDPMAVALIDSGSFTEKDIIAKVTFDSRPSTTNSQKRAFKGQVDTALENIQQGSSHTDVTGGVLQANEYLTETGAEQKYLFVFSDLEEDLKKRQIRDFPVDLPGVQVVALNVTKLRSDNIDPRDYAQRLERWEERVEQGGGSWRVINDLEHLNQLITLR